MEHPAESTNLAGKGVTVDELNSIFTNFVQHNSSVSFCFMRAEAVGILNLSSDFV